MSKPVRWLVRGRLLATSRSQIPVPVAMSATLRVGDVVGILGWIRKPRVFVVKMCCSSSLLRSEFGGFDGARSQAYLSGISSMRGQASGSLSCESAMVPDII